MPPRKRVGAGPRRGKWAGTAFERPLDDKPSYPGVAIPRESTWDAYVAAHCKARKALAYHTWDSRRSASGYYDWTILGHRGLLLRENKVSDTGDVSETQAEWVLRARAIGLDADVWWFPRDWNSGRVQNEINAITRRAPEPVDVTSELGQLMYLSTVPPEEVPGAALLWDAGARVNREWWRKEAHLMLQRAMLHLPVGVDETAAWLRAHRLKPDADPAAVLAAVRETLLRHEPLDGVLHFDAEH